MLMRSVKVVRPSMANLTVSANTMFSQTMRCVFREISTASATLEGSSSTITISAASMAASEPMFPMAIPTSALASEGASLIPSPMNTVVPFDSVMISSSFEVLSAGRSSDSKRSSPNSFDIDSATDLPSPVSMQALNPIPFSLSTASRDSSFRESEISMWPAYLPSTAT